MSKFIMGGFGVIFAGMVGIHMSQPIVVEDLPSSLSKKSTLIYFGAKDCAPCVTYKRTALRDVKKSARKHRFKYVSKSISSVRKLNKDGAFGAYDPIYRAARGNGVPYFVVMKDKKIIFSRAGNWPAAVNAAKKAAQKPPTS